MTAERFKGILRAFRAELFDPPGWIPAWALTGAVLWLARSAVSVGGNITSSGGQPVAVEVLRIVAHTYEITLGLWLAYKGLGAYSKAIGGKGE